MSDDMTPEMEAEIRSIFAQVLMTERISDLLEVTEALTYFLRTLLSEEEAEDATNPLLQYIDGVLMSTDPDEEFLEAPTREEFLTFLREWIFTNFDVVTKFARDHGLPKLTLWVPHTALTGFTQTYFRQWSISPNVGLA